MEYEVILVCRYSPAGNWRGEYPYTEAASSTEIASNCPSGYSKDATSGLCKVEGATSPPTTKPVGSQSSSSPSSKPSKQPSLKPSASANPTNQSNPTSSSKPSKKSSSAPSRSPTSCSEFDVSRIG
mmetsp:Transcript_5198/g.6510  ORF Transcript_5198/g.6510 Transcript_5198/m.6510 type:complete len:126 (+) Transcript_5198:1-378(+)